MLIKCFKDFIMQRRFLSGKLHPEYNFFMSFTISVRLIKRNILHTHIHNWSLKPFSQDYCPSSWYHLYCVNLQCKVDSEQQSFCQKSAQRKSPKKYVLCFILMSGVGLELRFYV